MLSYRCFLRLEIIFTIKDWFYVYECENMLIDLMFEWLLVSWKLLLLPLQMQCNLFRHLLREYLSIIECLTAWFECKVCMMSRKTFKRKNLSSNIINNIGITEVLS